MIDFSTLTGFEWDAGNATKNLSKHGVSCREAEEIFLNRPLVILGDLKHSRHEARFHALGHTDAGRLLHASFTLRGKSIRIISIRTMNAKERKVYEKK